MKPLLLAIIVCAFAGLSETGHAAQPLGHDRQPGFDRFGRPTHPMANFSVYRDKRQRAIRAESYFDDTRQFRANRPRSEATSFSRPYWPRGQQVQ